MNINYEHIIEKAALRAEKLREFQEYAADADQQAEALVGALLYFSHLGDRAEALDRESREMLVGVANRSSLIGKWAREGYATITTKDGWGSDASCIMALVEHLK